LYFSLFDSFYCSEKGISFFWSWHSLPDTNQSWAKQDIGMLQNYGKKLHYSHIRRQTMQIANGKGKCAGNPKMCELCKSYQKLCNIYLVAGA